MESEYGVRTIDKGERQAQRKVSRNAQGHFISSLEKGTNEKGETASLAKVSPYAQCPLHKAIYSR